MLCPVRKMVLVQNCNILLLYAVRRILTVATTMMEFRDGLAQMRGIVLFPSVHITKALLDGLITGPSCSKHS